MATGFQRNMLKIPRLVVCLGALLLCVCAEIPEYAVVNLKASPPDGGTVSSNPPGPEYNIGMTVTFNAVAKQGYVFKRWEGWVSDTLNTVAKTITGDKYNENTTATAYFAKVYTLRVYATPADGGTVTASPPDTTVTNGTLIYEDETQVRVKAAAGSGYRFWKWSGASTDSMSSTTITMDRDRSLAANFVKVYKLAVNANPEEGGTVAITPRPNSDSTYDVGQPVNVVATPNPGYIFDRWSGDTTSTSTAIRLSMDRRWNVTANFVKVYKLSVIVDPTVGGTVTLSPPPPRDSAYDAGTQVTATPKPNSGYRFDGWTGDTTSTNTEIRLSMNRRWNVTANFVKVYKLTVIGMNANNRDTLWVRDSLYDEGTRVPVTAPAISGYKFDRWYGALTGRDGTIIMDYNKLAIAFYVPYKLNVTVNPTGGGTVTLSPPPPKDSAYAAGTLVTAMAAPKSGYRFDGWTGDTTSTNTEIRLPMNRGWNIVAKFVKVYKLTVIGMTAARDTLWVKDSLYDYETQAPVTAPEISGYRFDRWYGALTVSDGTIIMDANKLAIAIYVRLYTLTINHNPIGGGTTTAPDMYTYDEGTTVQVTTKSNMGFRFINWSGASAGTTPTTSVTMDGHKTLTANYSRVKYTLTVTDVGTSTHDSGAVVNVTAGQDSDDYRFTGWSGASTSTSPTISITMNKNETLTANYVRVYKLEITVTPDSSGTVTVTIGNGTPVPYDGPMAIDAGASVTVTASAEDGYIFTGWSGASTSTSSTISFTAMNEKKTLTAIFSSVSP